MIQRLTPPGVPTPRGPYSPAVLAGGFLFVAGQVPVDPLTDTLSSGDIAHETRLVLNNVKRVVEGAGGTLADVVRVGVYIKDGADFAAMNAVYAEFFGENKPARSTIVCGFAADIKVEIDCVAFLGK